MSCNDCVYCVSTTYYCIRCENKDSKYYQETDDSGKLPWHKGCRNHSKFEIDMIREIKINNPALDGIKGYLKKKFRKYPIYITRES